jgi:hypothetical protein
MSDPKPCPFCGSEAAIARSNRGWKVECYGRYGSCFINARTHYQPTKYLAENAWNTRAVIPPTNAQLLADPRVKALVLEAYKEGFASGVCSGVGGLTTKECFAIDWERSKTLAQFKEPT